MKAAIGGGAAKAIEGGENAICDEPGKTDSYVVVYGGVKAASSSSSINLKIAKLPTVEKTRKELTTTVKISQLSTHGSVLQRLS